MRALRTADTYLRRALPLFAVIAAGTFGTVLPGPLAAAVGFVLGGVTVLVMRNRVAAVVEKAIPEWMADQEAGLSLAVVRLRNGTWWPETLYKPNLLPPYEAVRLLHQAAAQIADDWDLDERTTVDAPR